MVWITPMDKLMDISHQLRLLSKRLNDFGFEEILRETSGKPGEVRLVSKRKGCDRSKLTK